MWDLKLKRPVISFTDPNNKNQRNSCIAWSPDTATRVIIASEDDRNPVLQVWDLRNAFAPLSELRGHSKGILSASWCPFDPNLLISSAKDNRTLVWDPDTAECLSELPSASNWAFHVGWSPKMVGLMSAASFSGEVSVYSVQDAGATTTTTNAYDGSVEHTMRPPKWLKRPCSVRWVWRDAGVLQREGRREHRRGRHRRAARPSLRALQAALASRDLEGYCQAKAEASADGRDGPSGS